MNEAYPFTKKNKNFLLNALRNVFLYKPRAKCLSCRIYSYKIYDNKKQQKIKQLINNYRQRFY